MTIANTMTMTMAVRADAFSRLAPLKSMPSGMVHEEKKLAIFCLLD
jgi:hypothetical protein